MSRRPGFTLLDVLVAGTIAAAMMAVLLGVMRDGAVSMQASTGTEMALAVARNHLTLVEQDISHAANAEHGQDGAFLWEYRITREASASPGPGIVAAFLARNTARPVLLGVEVVVRWQFDGKLRQIRLATHRLAYTAPTGDLE